MNFSRCLRYSSRTCWRADAELSFEDGGAGGMLWWSEEDGG